MTLPDFIIENMEAILAEWDRFAGSLPSATDMDTNALRDHAEQMLRHIVEDMRTAQSAGEQEAKSKGKRPQLPDAPETAAAQHGSGRFVEGLDVNEVIAEYRALRASVIRLWTRGMGEAAREDLDHMVRFNEAIDEAITESVARFSSQQQRLAEQAAATLAEARDNAELDKARLEALLEAIPSAVVLIEASTRTFAYINRRAKELHGTDYTGVDLEARTAKARILKTDGSPYAAEEMPFRRSLRSGEAVRSEEMMIERVDGERLAVLVSSAPVFDAAGKPVSAVVVFDDISERKRREADLALLNDVGREVGRLSSTDEILQSAGARIGTHLGVSSVNFSEIDGNAGTIQVRHRWEDPDAHRHTFDAADHLGDGFIDASRAGETLVVRDTQQDARISAEGCAGLGIGSFVTVPFQTKGEWKAFLTITDTRARDWRQDEVELIEELAQRIFPRLERVRAEEQLRESDRRKDEFLATLGHELRNPLAAIRNAAELMKLAAPDDSRLNGTYRILERQSAHMARLIDDLLEVSRIGRGKIPLQKQTLDVREVIEGVMQDRITQLDARELELRVDVPGKALWVSADRVRLAQVFDNLVGNAVKFTPVPGEIRLMLEEEDGSAVIRIRDTGIGIRSEMLERLFEPFQQETQDIAQSGLGLGLALSKGLVELHGGSIRAHSKGPGSGAEFEVRLPLTSPPQSEQTEKPVRAAGPRRILIVEDNSDAAESLRDLLEALGHDVRVAESGSDALGVLCDQPADVVFCDLGLPGMNGYDLARSIRGDSKLRNTRLVALTGYGQPEDKARSEEAGFDSHLTKPVDADGISRTLDELPPK